MADLSSVVEESMAASAQVSVFGLFTVSDFIIDCWILSAVICLGAFLITRNLKRNPSKPQVFLEFCIGFFNNFCKINLGKHWRSFAPWLGTVAVFIAFCNLSPVFGVTPPTKNIAVTLTLALSSFFLIYVSQFRYRGLKGGLHRFIEPVPFLLPLNLLEVLIRPTTLCMRLFGVILAGHVIMDLISALVPVVVPAVFGLYFDIFDGVIQTVVFVFLTTLFVSESIGAHEEA